MTPEELRADAVFVEHQKQELQRAGEFGYLIDALQEDKVRCFWNKGWFPEAVWILKAVDYLSQKHTDGVVAEYQDIRLSHAFSIVPGPTLEYLTETE